MLLDQIALLNEEANSRAKRQVNKEKSDENSRD